MTVHSSGFPLSSLLNEMSLCDTPTPKGLPELFSSARPLEDRLPQPWS